MASRKSLSGSRKNPLSLSVVPAAGKWQVRKAGASRTTAVHATQAEAVEVARGLLRQAGGKLRIHDKNGRIVEAMTLGRRAITRISAVEGISLGGEIARDLKTYDAEGLSSQQRRARIAEKYAGAKPKR